MLGREGVMLNENESGVWAATKIGPIVETKMVKITTKTMANKVFVIGGDL